MNFASLTLSLALCTTSLSLAQTPGGLSGPDAAPSTPSQSAFLEAHPGAAFFTRDGSITRVYGKAFSNGATPTDSADAFLKSWASVFGTQFSERRRRRRGKLGGVNRSRRQPENRDGD